MRIEIGDHPQEHAFADSGLAGNRDALAGPKPEIDRPQMKPAQHMAFEHGLRAWLHVRAYKAIATIAEPPMIMLMPTSNPSVHAAVPGSPVKIIAARIKSMMPLTSIQPHRPDSSGLCSRTNITEATPQDSSHRPGYWLGLNSRD